MVRSVNIFKRPSFQLKAVATLYRGKPPILSPSFIIIVTIIDEVSLSALPEISPPPLILPPKHFQPFKNKLKNLMLFFPSSDVKQKQKRGVATALNAVKGLETLYSYERSKTKEATNSDRKTS